MLSNRRAGVKTWSRPRLTCLVVYCIVVYCIVVYCIVVYCIVVYCTKERDGEKRQISIGKEIHLLYRTVVPEGQEESAARAPIESIDTHARYPRFFQFLFSVIWSPSMPKKKNCISKKSARAPIESIDTHARYPRGFQFLFSVIWGRSMSKKKKRGSKKIWIYTGTSLGSIDMCIDTHVDIYPWYTCGIYVHGFSSVFPRKREREKKRYVYVYMYTYIDVYIYICIWKCGVSPESEDTKVYGYT